MLPGLHLPELIILLVVALLIFGPKKLPEMGSAIGKSFKEFKKGMNELTAAHEEPATPSNLEAIERELASKKAAAEAAKVNVVDEAAVKEESHTEAENNVG